MTIRITGDGPKITATGSGSTVLVEISTGQHDPGSFSGVHNDLTGRSTTGAHVGTAVSIDPSGFAGNLDESITNAQLLAAAVDDLTTGGGGGGGGGASLSDATPQALGTAAAGTGTAAARDDHVHAMPTAADVGADADGAAQAVADSLGGAAVLDVGTTTGTVAAGDDSRLSDARTPTSHNHAASEVTSGTLDIARIPTGTSSTTAALGDHNHSGVYQPADADLTTIAGLTATTDSFIQAKSSAWAARTIAQVKADVAGRYKPIVRASRCDADSICTPLTDIAAYATVAVSAGNEAGAYCETETGTLSQLHIEITATSATSGQLIYVVCRSVVGGGPGAVLWSESFAANTATVLRKAVTQTLPGRQFISVLNPTGNAGAVTFRGHTPAVDQAAMFEGLVGVQRSGTWSATTVASATPIDLTSWKYDTTAIGGKLDLSNAQIPIVAGRMS